MTAFEVEHERDPRDLADALVLLDDDEVRVVIELVRDDEEAPERFRNYKPARVRVVREDRA